MLKAFSSCLSIVPVKLREFLWSSSGIFDGPFAIALRYCILKSLIKDCGDNVYVGKFVCVRNWSGLSIGSNVSIHAMCYIDAAGGVSVGDNVSIAHQVSLISFNHSYQNILLPIKYNPNKLAPIAIHEDVWVGCGVRLLAGVVVEQRSIVAAGAVVNRAVERGSIVGGVPAKKIGMVSQLQTIEK
ncbi:acetyltransferase-like isoleucine patch superfamily enzyme [Rhodopirellula rubra]|uniref:Acetyltransferase-like isoleucine patch superfamily enzyme n=1 Tax=Aporhodopirellula rubra TaxID=980271 RepID=A0A7W5H7U7_9BACT|nr:acetyltransferase-like isoleucine patch superfamily enzyme [Aporhodopirellula rubra]